MQGAGGNGDHRNDGRRESGLMGKRLRVAGFSLLVTAALVGVAAMGVVFVAPERLDDIRHGVTALGSGYRLPDTPSLVKHSESELGVLKTFSKVFVNIAKQTRPALVFINTRKVVAAQRRTFPFSDDFFFPFGAPPFDGGGGRERGVQEGAGSGFLVDLAKGYVITNNHVVADSDEIRVKTFDDREFKGRLLGREPSVDVAVVEIQDFTPGTLQQVGFGNSDVVEVGDWVVALGAPFSLPQTLTMGVVSAMGRGNVVGNGALEDFIQTDAAINPGNSGGPLLNLEGQVVGINTAISSPTGSSAGIGFAVPSNMAKLAAEQLINEGKVTRGYLGIEGRDFEDLSDEVLAQLRVEAGAAGTMVVNVVPGSPAERAGLKPYDVLKTLNGQAVTHFSQLRAKLAFTKPGTEVRLGLVRDGKPLEVTATVAAYDERGLARARGRQGADEGEGGPLGNVALEEFGLSLAPVNARLRQELGIRSPQGVIVTEVSEESDAAAAGLRRGDVLVEINRAAIKGVPDVEAALQGARDGGRDVLFLVERNGRTQLILYRRR